MIQCRKDVVKLREMFFALAALQVDEIVHERC